MKKYAVNTENHKLRVAVIDVEKETDQFYIRNRNSEITTIIGDEYWIATRVPKYCVFHDIDTLMSWLVNYASEERSSLQNKIDELNRNVDTVAKFSESLGE